jgi:hypothetical protein
MKQKLNALELRKRAKANELYKVANDLRRAIFVNGGQPDDIMKVAQDALRIIRIIDNPILDKNEKTTP